MATSLTQEQIDTIVRTVLGEAAGEGRPGMEAVAWTILNRANSGKYPSDPAKVAKQPSQFSAWNSAANGGNDLVNMSASDPRYKQALEIVNDVLGGNVPDPTGGALFYHTQNISPYWSDSVNNYGTVGIGAHQFYPSHPVPPMNIPDVASQTDTTAPYSPAIPLPKPPPLNAPNSFSPPAPYPQMRGRGLPATGAPTMARQTRSLMDSIGAGPIGGGQFREDLAPPRPVPTPINIPGSPGASPAATGAINMTNPNWNVIPGLNAPAPNANWYDVTANPMASEVPVIPSPPAPVPGASQIERGPSYPNPSVLLNYAAQVASQQAPIAPRPAPPSSPGAAGGGANYLPPVAAPMRHLPAPAPLQVPASFPQSAPALNPAYTAWLNSTDPKNFSGSPDDRDAARAAALAAAGPAPSQYIYQGMTPEGTGFAPRPYYTKANIPAPPPPGTVLTGSYGKPGATGTLAERQQAASAYQRRLAMANGNARSGIPGFYDSVPRAL